MRLKAIKAHFDTYQYKNPRTENPCVVGSIPIITTSLKSPLGFLKGFFYFFSTKAKTCGFYLLQ